MVYTDGLLGTPSSGDYSIAIEYVVPAEDRDFRRLKEPYQAETISNDMNYADTTMSEEQITQAQQFVASGPLGTLYAGKVNGKLDKNLLYSLIQFEGKLNAITGNTYNIVSGNGFNYGALNRAKIDYDNYQKKLKKKDPTEEEEEEAAEEAEDKTEEAAGVSEKLPEEAKSEEEKAEIIKGFQSFLSTSLPIAGSVYTGPIDGKPESVAQAAQRLENIIARAVGDNRVKGMIWNATAKMPATSTADIIGALTIISQYKQDKKDEEKEINVAQTRKEQLLAMAKKL